MRWLPLLIVVAAFAEERWTLQYHFDQDEAEYNIAGLSFPSKNRGVGVGTITERGKTKHAAIVTSDGGKQWKMVPLKKRPVSLYFLDEHHGWMVAEDGIWKSQETGLGWKKIKDADGLLRVHFVTPQHGWAVGYPKTLLETHDGGVHWKAVEAASEPKSNPRFTSYNAIAFADEKTGIVAGASRPPRRDEPEFPAWMDPDNQPRVLPALTILLETRDGGATWRHQTTSIFGVVTHVRLAADGSGIALLRFEGRFDYPSVVVHLDWKTGASKVVYRQKDRVVTDLAVVDGGAVLAAVEPPGSLANTPVPGKLRMLRGSRLTSWKEMKVDYRAAARRAVLASQGSDLWVATDTGMILKLESH